MACSRCGQKAAKPNLRPSGVTRPGTVSATNAAQKPGVVENSVKTAIQGLKYVPSGKR